MLRLIVMSGLPVTGKSSIAREVARRCDLTLVVLDHIEAPLLKQGITGHDLGCAGYEMLEQIARDNLAIGRSVLVDAVTWTNEMRARGQQIATDYSAEFLGIEVICSDEQVHERRTHDRKRNISGYPEITWANVVKAKSLYESWSIPRLVVDSLQPLGASIAQVEAAINQL